MPLNKLALLGYLIYGIRQVELIDLLSAAGCGTIEAASFVSPKWVPQMADGREVLAKIRRAPGVKYAALTPNLRGLEGALEAGVDEVQFVGKFMFCTYVCLQQRCLPYATPSRNRIPFVSNLRGAPTVIQ